ncbi:MAG: HAD family hydrolase [Alphaproteobacteria bacterium]|nr:MAG: HAD family hydrolase [Alphaproteobacteria bacterium]
MRCAIFDLDGTIADTAADLILSANRTLGETALIDPARDRELAFHGGKAMLREGLRRRAETFDEARIEALYDSLLVHYRRDICLHTRPFPGLVEALDALEGAGWRFGICTNKPEALARALMAELALDHRFPVLVGPDTFAERKPHPLPFRETVRGLGGEVGRSLLIGDSRTDRDTARAAGVPVVLVTFGVLGRDVADLAPDGVLDDYADLPALLEALLPAG